MRKILFCLAVLLLTGCSSGVSQREYNDLKDEKESLSAEYNELKQKYDAVLELSVQYNKELEEANSELKSNKIIEETLTENNESESKKVIELSTGTYVVGIDGILPGRYDVQGISMGNVKMYSPGEGGNSRNIIVNEIIKANESVYKGVSLQKYCQIEITNGGSINLIPR